MKILHYTLGFPPHRSGGLVNYSINLMESQMMLGHEVYCLYPGNSNFFLNKKSKIRKKKKENNICVYELVNSLPLAIFNGINSPKDFSKEAPVDIYKNILNEIQPDVIHVHTLMGIHLEFFMIAKSNKIPIVFTSHDYYGLFPIPSFYYQGKSYDLENTSENWLISSENSLSTIKLRFFQSRYYPLIRKVMRKFSRISMVKNPVKFVRNNKFSDQKIIEMDNLRKYYLNIFSNFSYYHFNSSVSQEVFICNLPFSIRGKVINITNIGKTKEINRTSNKEKIRIGYIGPDEEFKGFFDYVDISKKLSNRNYEFHTFGYIKKYPEYKLIEHGKFTSNEIDDVYSSIDILIVPSKWKETFGLIVIEALSFGIEVFVSDNVGAKDILDDYHIYKDIDEVVGKLRNIPVNENDLKNELKSISEHSIEIIRLYDELLRM